MNNRRLIVTAATAGLVGGSLLLGMPAAGASDSHPARQGTVELDAKLTPLNRSGATGKVEALVKGETIRSIELEARGLSPDLPHAVHIHYGDDARNECPTMGRDAMQKRTDGTKRLNTVDGVPAYGPVVVSLTTKGDTSPASTLAVDRFASSHDGDLHYHREGIAFTDVAGTGYPGAGGTGTAAQIAEAIRDGEGVVVVHGVDYNRNGTYDFASAGASELVPDGSLPAEATDPAACGVLR